MVPPSPHVPESKERRSSEHIGNQEPTLDIITEKGKVFGVL